MLNQNNKNMRSLTVLFLFLTFFISSDVFSQGKDYALFFVVTDFDYWQDFPKNTEQQVRKIERELKNNYGFQTEFISNPTRKTILNKIKTYSNKRYNRNDQLLIYFSMHGQYEEGGSGALIPKDGRREDYLYETWIQHSLLEDIVNRINCKHIILSMDACYSGTFGGVRGKPKKPAFDRMKDCKNKRQIALQNKSRFYITSGGKVRTPIRSSFSDKWLEALRYGNNDGVLTFSMLYAIVEQVNPRPRFGEFGNHHDDRNFVFVNYNNCKGNSIMTDNDHWKTISELGSKEDFINHIKRFPSCIHLEKIFSKGNQSEKIETKDSSGFEEEKNNDSPKEIDKLFSEINDYLKRREYNKSLEEKLNEAMILEPNNYSLRIVMGNIYNFYQKEENNTNKAQEYFLTAVKYYKEALALNSESFKALYSLGELYYNKAARLVTKYNELPISASLKEVVNTKSKYLEAFEMALPYFLKADAINSKDYNTILALSEIYAKKDDYTKSQEYKRRLDALK